MFYSKSKVVFVAAAGTGGHVFPALACARALQQHNVEVQWLGTPHGLEQQLVGSEFPLHPINMTGFRRKGLFSQLKMPFQVGKALLQVSKLFSKYRPALVLTMGGYVTVPAGMMAYLKRVPLVIHEQNAVAGLSNRLLAPLSRRALQAFPGAFSSTSAVTVGNPIRQSLLEMPGPAKRYEKRTGPIRILVLGGSQGAVALNEKVSQAILQIKEADRITVWHQVGRRDLERMQQAYEGSRVSVRVVSFIDNMDEAYTWADWVICRAGALTVSELAAVGLPSLLVPFPGAVDNHQWHNAKFLVDADAAVSIDQTDLTPELLQRMLNGDWSDRKKLRERALSAQALSGVQSTEQVVNICMQLLQNRK